jgi:Uma2 family endonuclease
MTSRVAPWTYRDYAALPDDGRRYEIHDGELWEMAAPSTLHQILVGRLSRLLDAHVTAQASGLIMIAPLDVILSDRPSETTVLQPDVIYIERARMDRLLHMRGIEGPPALAVEILSPSTAVIDRTRKRDLYARYGVSYLWFVDPEAREIEAHALEDGIYGLIRRVSGTEPVDLPPFVDLALVPASLWPEFTIRP